MAALKVKCALNGDRLWWIACAPPRQDLGEDVARGLTESVKFMAILIIVAGSYCLTAGRNHRLSLGRFYSRWGQRTGIL